MKFSSLLVISGLTALSFTACQKDEMSAGSTNAELKKGGGQSQVYTLNNLVADNKVMVFDRSPQGMLSYAASYSTGGQGTGGGLGNQGALAFSDGERFLFAVNAGSDEISCFSVSNSGLQLVSRVSSNGIMPISVTAHGHMVYVLNAGGTGNITGFMFDNSGMLSAIPNSTRSLSTNASGPAQVSFSPQGDALVVTEKATNSICSFGMNADGTPGTINTIASAGVTPFGFSFGKQNSFVVTEAAGGAPGASTVSSYHVNGNGTINLIYGPVATNSSAACWAVTTNDGKSVFITNTADNTVSSIAVDTQQNLSLGNSGNATSTQGGPIDAALSKNSQYLYVLNAGGHSITSYAVGKNGSLSLVDTDGGLPTGTTGLLAR